MADVEKRPVKVYIAHGHILHDGVLYEDGTEIRGSLFSAEQEEALRKLGALKLPAELASPEDLQDVLDFRARENEELKAKLAALEAAGTDEPAKKASK